MGYILARDRVIFIEENILHAFGYNDPHDQPRALFEQMINPWEIHYFVSRFNWDDNPTVLGWITNTQLCDKATALMVFWRAAPGYYTRYATEEEADADYDGGIYRLIKNIITNWKSEYYISHQIAYNPLSEAESEVNYQNPKAKWFIPESMKRPLGGEELIIEK